MKSFAVRLPLALLAFACVCVVACGAGVADEARATDAAGAPVPAETSGAPQGSASTPPSSASPPPLPPPPPPAPSCTDALRNGAESDVDCGADCPPCKTGMACAGA